MNLPEVIDFIKGKDYITPNFVAKHFGVGSRAAWGRIRTLVELGAVEKVSRGLYKVRQENLNSILLASKYQEEVD